MCQRPFTINGKIRIIKGQKALAIICMYSFDSVLKSVSPELVTHWLRLPVEGRLKGKQI
jgi:hypothetical protein